MRALLVRVAKSPAVRKAALALAGAVLAALAGDKANVVSVVVDAISR